MQYKSDILKGGDCLIDENEKVYIICEQCVKAEQCEYYPDVIRVSQEFVGTPLNIHFPKCADYKSKLIQSFEDIESENVIPEFNDEFDKNEFMSIFKTQFGRYYKNTQEDN